MKKVLLFLIAICYSFVTNAATQTITVGDFEYSLTSSSSAVLVSGKDATGDVVIPKTILFDGSSAKVSGIGEGAFKGSAITSVKISNTIHSIPNQAFANCENLVKVDFLGGAVTEIGESAFSGCVNLTEVNLEGVEEIGEFAFYDCSSLKSITVPSSVKELGRNSLNAGKNMDVTIESASLLKGEVNVVTKALNESVRTLKLDADTVRLDFAYTPAPINYTKIGKVDTLEFGPKVKYVGKIVSFGIIQNLVIGENVTSMVDADILDDREGFRYKSIIYKVIFKCNVDLKTMLGSKSVLSKFSYEITSVEFAEGVTSITGNIFANYANPYESYAIREVVLPSTLEILDDAVFKQSRGLMNINLPEKLKVIDEEMFYNSGIPYIKVPGTIEEVENRAFIFCKNLNTLILEEGVKKVGDYVLWECNNLNHIEIPSTVTVFGIQNKFETKNLTYLKDLSDVSEIYPENMECTIITNTEARADVYREKGYMNVFSMEGLKYSKADVNRDGEINTKDVKKVYEEIMNQ